MPEIAARLRRVTETIEIPVWFAVLAGAFAVVALVERLLFPSVKWFFRARLNRAIERLNKRLDLEIQPFKLTKRKVLIDRLVHDPMIMHAIAEAAEEEGVPREVVAERAERYAREIVPSFSVFAYFGLATRGAKWLSQALYRVRLTHVAADELRGIDPEATVIFVMNHRSNMDYVLVTYLVSSRSALSYAVGEWARVWPLQPLIRAMGGYFIRRKSLNPLYRKVLSRYVKMATEGGVAQAIFPEGRLSRDGHLQEPKLGLLSYLYEGFDDASPRDVVFIPIALNYDRVIEDRTLLPAAGDDSVRFKVSFVSLGKFFGKLLRLRLQGKYHRFGYAGVAFGVPLSLRHWKLAHPDVEDPVGRLGADLMGAIGALVPVLPLPVLATVLMQEPERSWSEPDLKLAFNDCLELFKSAVAKAYIPRKDAEYAFENALRHLDERRLITNKDGVIAIDPQEAATISYYANSIAHLVKQ